jgi:hypothetical protein
MRESARVEVLCAEVRVLQVGNGQITLSMYRQLDETTFERFEPFGRVKDIEPDYNERVLQLVGRDTKTGALVRYYPRSPDWSRRVDGTRRDGPSEFAHWLLHTEQSTPDWPYPVADGPDGHRLLWPHVHREEDELSYVVAGTIWARVGERCRGAVTPVIAAMDTGMSLSFDHHDPDQVSRLGTVRLDI